MTTSISSDTSDGSEAVHADQSVTVRCEHCGEQFKLGEGRDGYCFTCSVHIACPCKDDE
jgi:hypothetical protein